MSPELQAALEPLLHAIESLSQRIVEYNERIENLAQQSYPQLALLKQIKGVGTLIALTFLLTLEDPHRFRKSRDVGGYLGLQPGQRNSGQETAFEEVWADFPDRDFSSGMISGSPMTQSSIK